MLGVMVNGGAILIGASLGLLLKKGIPEGMADTIMKGLSLCVIYIGISGALKSTNLLILISSMVLGGVIGEALDLDGRLNRMVMGLEAKFTRKTIVDEANSCSGSNMSSDSDMNFGSDANPGSGVNFGVCVNLDSDTDTNTNANTNSYSSKDSESDNEFNNESDRKTDRKSDSKYEKKKTSEKTSIGEGFITASLVYCVGAMAVVGSLQAGLVGNNEMLFTKAMLDGVSAIIFAASLGAGVLLSSLPVVVFQGAIVLLADFAAPYLTDYAIGEMTGVGSLLIMAIGLNLLKLTNIKIMNLMPAVFLPILFCYFL